MTMECPQIDLYEFLTESELQHYYNAVKNELKISNAAQFKYATDEDLKSVGMSRPEIRRLRKYYEKHFPHGYLSKIKRLLQAPATMVKRDDGSNPSLASIGSGSGDSANTANKVSSSNSPSKAPNNKHIIPEDSISVNKQLGTGEFGIVQQGVWSNGNERIQVAIKCLSRERMQSNPMEFLKEAAIMHSIEHENIVRLHGVVLSPESMMLVTELAHLRSLLECLKDSGLRISFLTIPTLCQFAIQICNGMKYLENKRLIHRDLAARNILVFSKNKVKISDFGLSRALGVGKDYYKTNFNVNLKLPIAWCAPECINYLRFTNASDVWAYGVCLWEMFSYGFQPWAALTGLQILEAIDDPNYQRLEQPDCCPREYYTLMMKCWQDDALKRPKFSEIYELLPDMKPEQLKAVVNCLEAKKDHLLYRQGDLITVLDRNTGTPFWKGVLSSGKTGFFNPSNTVAYLEGLPSSNRDSFCRVSERNSSKRKLRTEMISKPQNDFKHTGHVGIDGASFGDVAFLSNSQNYNHVPRQIVTPYKPSEDIEQTPLLLPPTPTSPDSLQTASGYFPEGATSMNPSFISSTENTPKHLTAAGQSSFEFPASKSGRSSSTNPFANKDISSSLYGMHNTEAFDETIGYRTRRAASSAGENWRAAASNGGSEYPHEYHEISDDEMTADKLDFGPSLMEEINSMFGSMSASINNSTKLSSEIIGEPTKMADNEAGTSAALKTRRQNSLNDTNGNNKFGISGSSTSKKKTAGTVKPISVKDEKILNHAIEIANEISARSMNDLVSDQPSSAQSPKRKFSFRFPHLSSNGSHDKSHVANNMASPSSHSVSGNNNSALSSISPISAKKKNFTDELQSIPDLQAIIGEEGREAYNSLIERKTAAMGLSPVTTLLHHLDTNEFEMATSRTLPRCSINLRSEIMKNEDVTCVVSRNQEQPVSVPLQNAPRMSSMTLPARSSRLKRTELILEQNSIINKENDDINCNSMNSTNDQRKPQSNSESPCESPSYMSNTFYKFPETTKTTHTTEMIKDDVNSTPLLPSREGKKHIKTNPKRHVRKYPLIIPVNGLQRTLNKVTEMGLSNEHLSGDKNLNNTHKNTLEVVASIKANKREPLGVAIAEPTYQNVGNEISTDSASLQFESILEADSNKDNVLQSPDVTDGFYNFSIQKEHYNKGKALEFDVQKISGLYVNDDDELRNLDIGIGEQQSLKLRQSPAAADVATVKNEHKDAEELGEEGKKNCGESTEITQNTCASVVVAMKDIPKRVSIVCDKTDNELAGNALFKRIRESVDAANNGAACNQKLTKPQTEAEYFAASISRLTDSNSVSCEDLLEFSDKKPKGCERGVDSDEVRIMMKVLGKDSTPPRCLEVLENIEWDVHKAIKIIKLQNIFVQELSFGDAFKALQKYEWDLHLTSLKLDAKSSHKT